MDIKIYQVIIYHLYSRIKPNNFVWWDVLEKYQVVHKKRNLAEKSLQLKSDTPH